MTAQNAHWIIMVLGAPPALTVPWQPLRAPTTCPQSKTPRHSHGGRQLLPQCCRSWAGLQLSTALLSLPMESRPGPALAVPELGRYLIPKAGTALVPSASPGCGVRHALPSCPGEPLSSRLPAPRELLPSLYRARNQKTSVTKPEGQMNQTKYWSSRERWKKAHLPSFFTVAVKYSLGLSLGQ